MKLKWMRTEKSSRKEKNRESRRRQEESRGREKNKEEKLKFDTRARRGTIENQVPVKVEGGERNVKVRQERKRIRGVRASGGKEKERRTRCMSCA